MVLDKDEQLRAVANNQTITNAALKASLCQKERELEDLKKSKASEMSRVWKLVEKLVRSENTRDRSELRQKLASDGARLGRIVHTRVGLRSVENWEEGHASKVLYRKKVDLEHKKEILMHRQSIVEKATNTFAEGKAVNDSAAGLILDNALSILEASESLKMHLNKVFEQEELLRNEESALNLEKAEHIRELKRVASEDASRFRSRPKVR
jgi:tousled-like kinase